MPSRKRGNSRRSFSDDGNANDLAEVLLGLYVPWNQLPALSRLHAAGCGTARDAYAKIWSIVEPAFCPHNRNFASNIDLLRKSKEDSQIDAALRKSMNRSEDTFIHGLDGNVPADLDSFDGEEALDTLLEDFSTETLIAAYHSRSWYKESLIAGQRIPTLLSGVARTPLLQLENLLPLDIFRLRLSIDFTMESFTSFDSSFCFPLEPPPLNPLAFSLINWTILHLNKTLLIHLTPLLLAPLLLPLLTT
jgi:hypothetical protein